VQPRAIRYRKSIAEIKRKNAFLREFFFKPSFLGKDQGSKMPEPDAMFGDRWLDSACSRPDDDGRCSRVKWRRKGINYENENPAVEFHFARNNKRNETPQQDFRFPSLFLSCGT